MSEALLNAIVIATGGMLAVGPPLVVLVILSCEEGLRRAAGFWAGYTGGYLTIGCASILIGSRVELEGAPGQGVVDVVMIALGALFIFFALKTLHAIVTDKPEGPSTLMQSLEQMSPTRTALLGSLISVINVKNLAIYLTAVATLGAAPSPLAVRLALVPVLALVFCATTAVPIVARLTFPQRSVVWLQAMKRWLEANKRRLAVGVLLIFGGLFLYKGLT